MNALFERGRQAFLEGTADWDTDAIKFVCVDADDYASLVSGVSNTADPTITTSAVHGLVVGDRVAIFGVAGATGVNANFDVVTVPTTTTFTVTLAAAPGVWTAGGYVAKLSGDLNLSSIPAIARVATSAALTSKTVTNGVADAADLTLTAVTGDRFEIVIIYKDTGVESTSRLLAHLDSGTNLPITPNGGDVLVQWANTATRIFKL